MEVISTMHNNFSTERLTSPPGYHFFGYYDKQQFDPSGRYLLATQADFMDRPPTEENSLKVGVIDRENKN